MRRLIAAGTPPSEIAVLFRINAQSEAYEEALAEAGVPYLVRGGERFFDRPEVRQAIDCAPRRRGRGARTAVCSTTVRAVLRQLGLAAERRRPAARPRERWESLAALVGLADEVLARRARRRPAPSSSPSSTRGPTPQHAPTVQGVTLASLHSAKGLEWDAVFLVGLVDGTLPIQHADGDEAAIEEERRLLYVGITRARRRLAAVVGAVPRRGRAAAPSTQPVPLRADPGLRPGRTGAAPAAGAAAKPRCRICGSPLAGAEALKLRRCTSCPSDVDIELLDRLKAWRSATAKEQQVPAYVVFTDATLTAIAEHRPADSGALVGIPGIGARKLDRYGAGRPCAWCRVASRQTPSNNRQSRFAKWLPRRQAFF